MYAYPAGTSFCSCASSRAALHVGSLFLRNRQPSNAPPLLLSPTGRATRRGPQMQNTLGGTPRPHAPERPLGTGCAVPKRGLNGAYRVSATHFYRLPRWSAKGEPPPLSCPCRSNVALLRFLARIAPVAPQGIVAVSATGGAPIPCPSEEGDCGESG